MRQKAQRRAVVEEVEGEMVRKFSHHKQSFCNPIAAPLQRRRAGAAGVVPVAAVCCSGPESSLRSVLTI